MLKIQYLAHEALVVSWNDMYQANKLSSVLKKIINNQLVGYEYLGR
jgi:hypothetical protein